MDFILVFLLLGVVTLAFIGAAAIITGLVKIKANGNGDYSSSHIHYEHRSSNDIPTLDSTRDRMLKQDLQRAAWQTTQKIMQDSFDASRKKSS